MKSLISCLTVLILAWSSGAYSQTCDQSLPWVSVDGRYFRERDSGHIVMMRGINMRIKGLFDMSFEDGRAPLQNIPEFAASDPQQMREAGYNFVRLPISWSALEPIEGQFSEPFLLQLRSVIAQLNRAGLYVLIDFHQDGYSKEVGEDGAPAWAILPALKKKSPGGPMGSVRLTLRRLKPETLGAYRAFFENHEGIQDRFWPAWRQVVGNFVDCPGILGYEPMNEPVSFHIPNNDALLQNFYEGALRELRSLDSQHALWLPPDYFNFVLTRKGIRPEPFKDSQIVFAPHLYPNLNPSPLSQGGRDPKRWRKIFEGILKDYEAVRASYGTQMLAIGEWGISPNGWSSKAFTEAFYDLTYARNYPTAVWLWKEESHGLWGYFDYDKSTATWTLNPQALQTFSLPGVTVAASRDLVQSLNRSTGTLNVTLIDSQPGGLVRVYLPPHWFPQGPRVRGLASRSLKSVGDGYFEFAVDATAPAKRLELSFER